MHGQQYIKYDVFDKDVVKDMCVEFMVGKPEGKRQHG
jgi:ribulose bisphosphate carboxylase small subunit